VKPSGEKNFLIIGPGALGCYVAARLAQKHARLWVLDHRAARAAELQERGLHVTGASMLDLTPFDGRIAASSKGLPKMDVIFLTVKTPALGAASAAAARLSGPKTLLVCLQNGWGFEKSVKWAPRRIVWGVTREALTLESSGRVVHAASGATLLDASCPGAKEIAGLMSAAGFQARVEKNFERERWMKLVVNACINPLGALADVTNGRLNEPPLAPLLERAAAECAALSSAAGRKMSPAEAYAAVRENVAATAANRNSLSQDLRRGKPTERDHLLAPFLDIARRRRVPAPTLALLNELLARVEKVTAA